MNAPVIDAVAVTTPKPATSAQDEAKSADVLTFQIGMAIVAAVLLVMTIVGVIVASAPLLIASGLLTVVAALVNVSTGVSLSVA
ncbi:mandelate racemase [Actinomyces procaprae]|uniref:mandelate racemase n=1 Tax=Actinomyces procaprae TaxID=2560010 RepID=UPI00109E0457|nr:mandelate racemase [Actinomyces procaprae]